MADKSLPKLKAKRSNLKGTVTRIFTFINAITDLTSVEEIKLRLEMLEKAYNEFKDVEENIYVTDESVPLEVEEFEERYYSAKAELRRLVSERQIDPTHSFNETMTAFATQQSEFFTTLTNRTVNQPRDTEIKLPRLNIPPFTGNYAEFPSFKDLYETAVHNSESIPNVHKFQYLKSLLRDEALTLVRHIQVTEANYTLAWAKIIKRYDKKGHVIHSHIKAFIEQPTMTQLSLKAIRKLCDTSDESIRGLRALGHYAQQRDPWLIFILLQKLDHDTRQLWAQKTINNEGYRIESFLEFLNDRCDALESCNLDGKKASPSRTTIKAFSATQIEKTCPKCNNAHLLFSCSEFMKLNINDRREFVRNKNLCFNCFSTSHQVSTCYSKYSCHRCRKRHHTLLHVNTPIETNIATTEEDVDDTAIELSIDNSLNQSSNELQKLQTTSLYTDISNTIQNNFSTQFKCHSLLPTALVYVTDHAGIRQSCRILLDSGSQASFISEACTNRLKLPRQNARIPVTGLASKGTVTKGYTSFSITSRYNTANIIKVTALILDKITTPLPNQQFDTSDLELVQTLQLADPTFDKTSDIDVLIGADHFFSILQDGKKQQPNGTIIAQNSIFGWIVSGIINSNSVEMPSNYLTEISSFNIINIDKTLKRFWELEELTSTIPPSPSELECESHYQKHHSRDHSGRYVIKLPFKTKVKGFGTSIKSAYSRLQAIERKFKNDENLKYEYELFMKEYLQLGHMERVPNEVIHLEPEKHFYLPHHAITKHTSTTTKVRVVFDGSCKSSTGVSLNETLVVGPTIQSDLYNILLQFRTFKIGFCADIEKMYRQILIAPEDRDYQRILWRNKPSMPPQHFRLTTVTYGTACAPFLAVRTLHQIAIDYKDEFPTAALIILSGFYVDDLLYGADSLDEAIKIKNELIELLAKGHFCLRKWSSSSPELLQNFKAESFTSSTMINDDQNATKILGLQWDSTQDLFSFKVSEELHEIPTKRNFLSEAAKIFDPLGWLSPSIIVVKILFQKLWLQGVKWDEKLPESIAQQWLRLRKEFKEFEKVKIPRYIHNSNMVVEYHGFADASEQAFAAVLYCRTEDEFGTVFVSLITSKSKVAPLKQISLPRLELCAAHLLSKLVKKTQKLLKIQPNQLFAWTDSSIVLSWLSDHPRRWKTYVGNRTSEIMEIIPSENWHHVRSSENPADHASRGVSPSNLINLDQWWKGPSWLSLHKTKWPSTSKPTPNEEQVIREERVNSVLTLHTDESCDVFYQNAKAKYSNTTKKTGFITSDELTAASTLCIKWAQRNQFREEIHQLNKNQHLQSHHNLAPLAPFIDGIGVLRVGGRLKNAQCPYDAKHPPIIPKNHILGKLIVRDNHVNYFHPGPSLLFHLLRQNYWIIDAKNLIKHTIKRCTVCVRQKAETSKQMMGNLPSGRVTPSRPFSRCGIDYAGPILLSSKKGRGATLTKGYIAVFVCFATKAIHLEVVSELSTEAFLAALKRFIARRGIPSDIHSDNATNFIGAKRKLPELYKYIASNNNNNEIISDYLARSKITWHLIPPLAPNFGGLWESAVKSVKYHLVRVIANSHFTYEEMTTFLCQVEAILNSRPLTTIPDDGSNIEILTPGHFLMLSAPTALPEPGYEDISTTRLSRWQNVQHRISGFWKKYSLEYLNTLQQRYKWRNPQENLKINDIVIIKDQNLPPSVWIMARIIQLHPGDDNLVRVATLKTATSTIKRPATKLCKLPVD